MRVVICGAGQVGFGIAERLAAEDNDVSVIDTSPRLIQSISDSLDVRGFVGNGAYPDVLAQAGAEDAEMLIAVTFSDEVNMIACQVAHSLFNVPTKVARVRAQSYLRAHYGDLFSRDHMPIDVIISPEMEVGEMVLRRLALPGAFDVMTFAEEQLVVMGVTCDEDCPIIDTPLRQLTELFPDLASVVLGIARERHLFVPKADDAMLEGDEVYVAVERSQISRVLHLFGHEERQATRVVIAGGGNIGLYVARELEKRNSRARIRIIENSKERAVDIADRLRRTIVLNGSALDEEILREADVAEAHTTIALTNDDEVNILSCVMAKKLGSQRNLCLINNSGYPAFTRALGIDAYVDPRAVTISRVLQHVRRGRISGVYAIQEGAAEIIEAEALSTSPLVDRPLRDVTLSDGIKVGAIYRDGKVIFPNSETRVRAKDRVLVFAMANRVREVEQLFRVSIDFF